MSRQKNQREHVSDSLVLEMQNLDLLKGRSRIGSISKLINFKPSIFGYSANICSLFQYFEKLDGKYYEMKFCTNRNHLRGCQRSSTALVG